MRARLILEMAIHRDPDLGKKGETAWAGLYLWTPGRIYGVCARYVDCKVYYELDNGNFHFIAGTLTGEVAGESPLKVEVASPVIEIWIQYTGSYSSFDHQVYVAVYGSSK